VQTTLKGTNPPWILIKKFVNASYKQPVEEVKIKKTEPGKGPYQKNIPEIWSTAMI
jgi:hypothetical protein